MEEISEIIMEVKPEPEDPVDYPLPELEVVACPLDIDIPTDSERVNQFCRLCLRELPTLFPLMSRVQNILIPDMIAAVTGININMRDSLPKKVCIQCLVKLDYAYHIRLDFAESNRVLKLLAKSRTVKLWECLRDYQKGVRVNVETRSEKLLRENKDIIRMRLIKKEEQLVNMTGEELVNVVLSDAVPIASGEQFTEIILDPEPNEVLENKGALEIQKDDMVIEFEKDTQTSNKIESSDSSEIESGAGSSKRLEASKKETVEKKAAGGARIAKILNYSVEFNETKYDPNKCYICQEQFSSVENLELHLPDHREMVPYNCEQCKGTAIETTSISTVIMLHRHIRMHAGSIKCPECPYRCFKGYCLYNHLKRFHLQDPNAECVCTTCGAKPKNKKSLENHMRMHKAVDEGRYTCSFCEKKFATKTRLTRHERVHTNERPYACRYCDKSFTNDTAFQAHERSHTGVLGYRCEECEKCYRTRSGLNIHLAMVHNIGKMCMKDKPAPRSGTPLKCPIEGCDYETTTLELNTHLATVHNIRSRHKYKRPPPPLETPKKCTYEGCNFEAITLLKYYQHRAKHAPKFKCPHCDLRFPTNQRLASHEYVHTKVKRYCCDLCGKTFRYSVSFRSHMANHYNIRKHVCGICNRSFVRSNNLKEHMKKHSDTLDYACKHCGKKYRYRADLFKHEKIHINEKPLTKDEVDLDCSDVMDIIESNEEFDEENLIVEYLDE